MMESSFIKVAHFTKIAFSELYIAFHKHHATNFKIFKSREWLKKEEILRKLKLVNQIFIMIKTKIILSH